MLKRDDRLIGTIMLNDGEPFSFSDLNVNSFSIQTVAHALSLMCRFGCHCDRFYSVAEHSVLVSLLEPSLEALLHDAVEAYIGDVPRPLKKILPEFTILEKKIEERFAQKHGLKYPWSETIKQADTSVLAAEMRVLMPVKALEWVTGIIPANVDILCLRPRDAMKSFMARYEQLKGSEQC